MTDLTNLRILIVDDERFVRSTIKSALAVIGRFIISEAADGETALDLVRDSKPELVLCDIGMQPVSGLEFVKRLRNHDDPALRAIAVMMVTAHADIINVQRAGRLTIEGYLVKPISPKQLRDRLDVIFRDRRPPQ
jgi:two-component system chemotaxis response regulator CheY